MGIENVIYPRPSEKYIYVERKPVDETCPRCGGSDVRRYPIIHYLGPRFTVTCQDCLYRLRLEPPNPAERWPPYWPVTSGWPWSGAG